MKIRTIVESIAPTVEYHWAGDERLDYQEADYPNVVRSWDRNNTGIPKPTWQELLVKEFELNNPIIFSVPQIVNNKEDIYNQRNTLSLTFNDTSAVTLSPTPTENIECHLWLDIGNGYEYQPNQDNFTPSDVVLDNLTTPGQYLVFAYNPTTHENGYIEFEVT